MEVDILKEIKYLDTVKFKETFKKIKEYFVKDETDFKVIFGVGNWLFKQIAYNVRINPEDRNLFVEKLKLDIPLCADNVLRSLYLKYTNETVLFTLTKHFYRNRVLNNFLIQMLNDATLCNDNLLEMKTHFVNWFRNIRDHMQKSNLMDILLRYYGNDPEIVQLSNDFRFEQNRIAPIQGRGHTVYDDGQNVHDHNINKNTIAIAIKLISLYETLLNEEEIKLYLTGKNMYDDNAESVLRRCQIDGHTFTSGDGRFKMIDLLAALIQYIKTSKHESDLLQRLKEEFCEMAGYCATGHIARFVNVLQGYDERFSVRINFCDQLYSVISTLLAQKIQKASENVILGTYDPDFKAEYLNFIAETVNSHLDTLYKDYGINDVTNNICDACEKFTHTKWHMVNNKIVLNT